MSDRRLNITDHPFDRAIDPYYAIDGDYARPPAQTGPLAARFVPLHNGPGAPLVVVPAGACVVHTLRLLHSAPTLSMAGYAQNGRLLVPVDGGRGRQNAVADYAGAHLVLPRQR